MLLGARQFFEKRGNGNVLPAGYTRVEKIATDGTSYIATDISAPISEFDWTLDMAMGIRVDFNLHRLVFGASYSSDICGITQGMFWNLRPGWHTSTTISGRFSAYQRIAIRLAKSGNTSTLTINGNVETTSTESPSATTGRLCFFGSASLYSVETTGFALYGARSVGGDFDIVPVVRDSDGAAGVYDMVSRQFFGNSAASGTILYTALT